MNVNENDKISPRQYIYLFPSITIAAGILHAPRVAAEAAGTDSWLVMLAGGLLFLFLTYLLNKLALLFPEETFVTFSQKIVGKWLGIILSILFVFDFFLVSLYEVRIVGLVSNVYLLDRTPLDAVILVYLCITIIGSRGGIEVIARTCQLLFPLLILITVLMSALIFPKLDFRNLLPILHTPWQTLSKATFTTSFFYIGSEMVLFLMPYLAKRKNTIKKSAIGFSIIIALYIWITISSISFLGISNIKNTLWPGIEVIKTLDIPGTIIERPESLFISIWISTVFATSILCNYFAAQITSSITGFRELKPILIFFIPFIFFFALLPNNTEDVFKLANLAGTFAFILIIIAAIVLLGIAKIRKI